MALNCQALLFFFSFFQFKNVFVQQCFILSSGRCAMFCLPVFLFLLTKKFTETRKNLIYTSAHSSRKLAIEVNVQPF